MTFLKIKYGNAKGKDLTGKSFSQIRFCLLLLFLVLSTAWSAEVPSSASKWHTDVLLSLSRFEQQAKVEVGAAKGERLVEQSNFSVLFKGGYHFYRSFYGGVFFQYDLGTRQSANFDYFDSLSQKTVVANQTGGDFWEVWAGPMVGYIWKPLFVEAGYGLLGLRQDLGRADLKGEDGNEDAFSVLPSVSYYGAAGVWADFSNRFALLVQLEYRVRYYHKRGGERILSEGVQHGTQNVTPFLGIRAAF